MISLGGVAKTGSKVEVAPEFEPFAYLETRTRRRGDQASSLPLLNKWFVSWWLPETIRKTKFDAFAKGSVPSWLLTTYRIPLAGRVLDGGAAAIKPRRFFVNRYGPAVAGRPRLSFTYYELDLERFPGAVAALLGLARSFGRRTGWAPGALAVYFVRRSGEKEAGNYSGPEGISCTLDPVTGAPEDPRFRQFLKEADSLIERGFGGRLSPSQSLPSALESADGGGRGRIPGGGGGQFRGARPIDARRRGREEVCHALPARSVRRGRAGARAEERREVGRGGGRRGEEVEEEEEDELKRGGFFFLFPFPLFFGFFVSSLQLFLFIFFGK